MDGADILSTLHTLYSMTFTAIGECLVFVSNATTYSLLKGPCHNHYMFDIGILLIIAWICIIYQYAAVIWVKLKNSSPINLSAYCQPTVSLLSVNGRPTVYRQTIVHR